MIKKRRGSSAAQYSSRRRFQEKNVDKQPSAVKDSYRYRRNSTLSHYKKATETVGSDRIHVHALARKQRNLGGLMMISLSAAALLGLAVWQFSATVNVAAINVAVTADDREEYENAVDEYLQRRPFERLRFALDKDALLAHMQSDFPEIQQIHAVEYSEFATTKLRIAARQPIAVWNIDGARRFVDDSGVSFTKNYYGMPEIRVVDNSGVEINQGEAIASSHFLGFVGQVIGEADRQGMRIAEVEIPPQTTRQLEVRLQGYEYPVRLSVDREVFNQVEDMRRTTNFFDRQNQVPSYVDVRVSGRAYYR